MCELGWRTALHSSDRSLSMISRWYKQFPNEMSEGMDFSRRIHYEELFHPVLSMFTQKYALHRNFPGRNVHSYGSTFHSMCHYNIVAEILLLSVTSHNSLSWPIESVGNWYINSSVRSAESMGLRQL